MAEHTHAATYLHSTFHILHFTFSISHSPFSISRAGLLTVEAKQRLTLKDLSSHPWLTMEDTPSTPLQTSCVLGQSKTTASALKQTFKAFYQATKAGFTLGDVSRAPLAKRRKNKRGGSPKSGEEEVNGSTSSLSTTSSVGESQSAGSGGESQGTASAGDSQTTHVEGSQTSSSQPHLRPSKLDLSSYCYETWCGSYHDFFNIRKCLHDFCPFLSSQSVCSVCVCSFLLICLSMHASVCLSRHAKAMIITYFLWST